MSEKAKAAVEIFKIEKTWDGILVLAKYVLIGYIVWLFYDGSIIVVTKTPEQIGALTNLLREIASVFTKANVPVWAGWPLAGGLLFAWRMERSAKKRAIKKVGTYRKFIESEDPGGRTSSGLSETGDTPEE